jgi:hypothetical protein
VRHFGFACFSFVVWAVLVLCIGACSLRLFWLRAEGWLFSFCIRRCSFVCWIVLVFYEGAKALLVRRPYWQVAVRNFG